MLADVETGVQVVSAEGLNLKLDYQGHFGEDTEVHSGGAKLGLRF